MDNDDALLPKKNVISANWKIGKKGTITRLCYLQNKYNNRRHYPQCIIRIEEGEKRISI